MGLFVRQEMYNEQPLYTVDGRNNPASSQQGRTLLIVGLGNIGKQYDGTRHNIGFAAVDHFASEQDFPDWIVNKGLKSIIASRTLGNARVILMRPTTLMNLSGEAVQAVQHFYRVHNAQTLIVHDELDIDFGQIRTRLGGSPAGHNGIKSIIQHDGEATGRLRVGIGPKTPEQIDSTDFVLAKFSPDQQKHFDALNRETNSILTEYIYANGTLTPETRSFIV